MGIKLPKALRFYKDEMYNFTKIHVRGKDHKPD